MTDLVVIHVVYMGVSRGYVLVACDRPRVRGRESNLARQGFDNERVTDTRSSADSDSYTDGP